MYPLPQQGRLQEKSYKKKNVIGTRMCRHLVLRETNHIMFYETTKYSRINVFSYCTTSCWHTDPLSVISSFSFNSR